MKNKISVIIVNKNDRGIDDTLTALLNIKTPKPFEIIVVDASDRKLDDIKKKFDTRINWFRFKQLNSKKRTIPDQRNYGLKRSNGDIIVFIDANCVPSSNWLKYLTYPIINEHEEIVAGGFKSQNRNYMHDDENNRRIGQRYLTECPTMNVAFSKKVFDQVGLFDENLGIAEDVDLCWRATNAGFKIRFEPAAEITHDFGSKKEDFNRAFRYGYGRAKLYKKHLNNWRNLFKKDIAVLVYPLYLLGLPLTMVFWPYPLIILIPFFKNLKNDPFIKVSYQLVYAVGFFKGIVT